MKICLITDNSWVKDSLVKLIDFECNFTHLENAADVNISFDFIFVDMQVNNNGGPSMVRELKRSEKVIDSSIVPLVDREADSFQAKRVGADSYLLKPLEKTKLKNLFT